MNSVITPPTEWQAAKIRSGIAETNRLIAKEERYTKDLQKVDYLTGLYAHLARLNKMLETGEGLPSVH